MIGKRTASIRAGLSKINQRTIDSPVPRFTKHVSYITLMTHVRGFL
jgi:hypothetical protein